MKSNRTWLLLPPALALLLALGPIAMQNGAPGAGDAANDPAQPQTQPQQSQQSQPSQLQAQSKAQQPPATKPALPMVPDLPQLALTLGGVLLLGAGGIWLVRKLRAGGRPSGGRPVVALRQTLRLSTRQAVHALEFDDRVLLIGESERGLALLQDGRLPERIADEAEIAARDDDGAVPKDLVIPRPDRMPPRRLPTPPGLGSGAAANGANANATNAAKGARSALGDFRALLQKAGRS